MQDASALKSSRWRHSGDRSASAPLATTRRTTTRRSSGATNNKAAPEICPGQGSQRRKGGPRYGLKNEMTETKQRQRRLPKYVRDPKGFGQMILTARDLEILDLVATLRFIHVDHAAALIDGSGRGIARRLQGLFHHGHLHRLVKPQRLRVDVGIEGSEKTIYALARQGYLTLQRERKLEGRPPVKWRDRYSKTQEAHIAHEVLVSTLRACLIVDAGRLDQVELEEWQITEQCSATVTPRGDRPYKLLPDGYAALRAGGELQHLYFEADRGTEEKRIVDHKFRNYVAYLASDVYEEGRENPNAVRVCFAVENPAANRMRLIELVNLWAKFKVPAELKGRRGGKGLFWFCDADDLRLAQTGSGEEPFSILTDPIWWTANGPDEPQPLIR